MPTLSNYDFLWKPLFEDSPTALILLDFSGDIKKLNSAAAAIYSANSVATEMNFNHCFPDLDFQEIKEKTINSDVGFKIPRFNIQHKIENTVVEILFKSILIDEKTYILCHLLDVTEAESSTRFLNFFSFANTVAQCISIRLPARLFARLFSDGPQFVETRAMVCPGRCSIHVV